MKRTIKRLLPLFICLLILFSIIWYLFVYDRSFMQELLLNSARFCEARGDHKTATWLYNQAYIHSENDDSVVIELAERFKKIGNYTQAEVVLTNGIKDGGSPELYMALCKTYVEQDKLLDAVAMLENITNPAIKAQLDALRPAVPTANPIPAYYSEYIDVHIATSGGDKLYLAFGRDFPSMGQSHSGDITLQAGENNITVIAVAENGLVSAPAYFSYVVGGVIEEITLSDPAFDDYVRSLLGIAPGDKLYSNDLWNIKSLSVPADVTNFNDLSRFIYLENLVIDSPNIKSLRPITALTSLKEVVIHGSPLSGTDLSILSALPNLESLTLNNCSLSNIAPLSAAKNLITLDLNYNTIQDLSPLAFLDKLSILLLSNNAVTNLSAISALENLAMLDVSYNSLTSLAPLASCPKLTALTANNNQIAEMPLFDDPSVLTRLVLADNRLTDVTQLGNYTSLLLLDLSYNFLTEVTSLSALDKLTVVDLSHNEITKLPSWSKNCALVEIHATHNKITSVTPLSGLMILNKIYLDYNNFTNVSALADCHELSELSIFGNKVPDVSMLTSIGVVVRYDPMV